MANMENTKFDLVIKNGKLILPNYKTELLDIGIKDKKIEKLGSIHEESSENVLDARGLIVLPGIIDSQVHFREPGLTHKEDIYHGTKGAVLGGVTTIFEMPNTNPATINEKELNIKLDIAERKSFCNYSFFIGAAKENISNLSKLEN